MRTGPRHALGTSRKQENESFVEGGYYLTCLEMQVHPLLCRTTKSNASRFNQLKVGQRVIGTFLERIGAVDSAKCWWCGDPEQFSHVYAQYTVGFPGKIQGGVYKQKGHTHRRKNMRGTYTWRNINIEMIKLRMGPTYGDVMCRI